MNMGDERYGPRGLVSKHSPGDEDDPIPDTDIWNPEQLKIISEEVEHAKKNPYKSVNPKILFELV